MVSAVSGGPWTPECLKIFKKAGMDLDDVANQVRLKGHQGPHSRAYHEAVLKRLRDVIQGCKSKEACRVSLVNELANIATELLTPGSEMRNLLAKGVE
jgi:hypothetical protein